MREDEPIKISLRMIKVFNIVVSNTRFNPFDTQVYQPFTLFTR